MPDGAPIFISYRRDDAAGHARALALALNPVFGADRVFIDADDMQPGENFETRLGVAVRAASVMLVLIGPRWRGERADGSPRLFDPQDFVRQELATALAAGSPLVLPLLLDGTPMPQAAQLPADLQALTQRHALPLAHLHYDADIARVVKAIGVTVSPLPAAAPARRLWLGAGVAAVLALGGGAWWALRDRKGSPSSPAHAERQRLNGLWTAEVPYAWMPAPRRERLRFAGEGEQLEGAVSFLGVERPLQEGRYSAKDGLHFYTTSIELLGDEQRELRHRYHGVPQDSSIAFEMQTLGGREPQPLLRFLARPAAPNDGVP